MSPKVIVALGGGSVIDTAKVLAAARGGFAPVLRYLQTGAGAEALSATPIIAVPTTAGTGSEVTCWATVWDTQSGKKYSLSRPNLYPKHAVVDPALMVGKPRQLTISTGLDALSHALESLWNVNVNPISAQHAVVAAREILTCPAAARARPEECRAAQPDGRRSAVSRPRLLQHAHRDRAFDLLSGDPSSWCRARHRMFVHAADDPAQRVWGRRADAAAG